MFPTNVNNKLNFLFFSGDSIIKHNFFIVDCLLNLITGINQITLIICLLRIRPYKILTKNIHLISFFRYASKNYEHKLLLSATKNPSCLILKPSLSTLG